MSQQDTQAAQAALDRESRAASLADYDRQRQFMGMSPDSAEEQIMRDNEVRSLDSPAPKLHSGGVVPKSGLYNLQKGEVVTPKKNRMTHDREIPSHIQLKSIGHGNSAKGEHEKQGQPKGHHIP